MTVEGSQTAIGSSSAVITSFRVYDPYHNDVTDQFEIVLKDGTLEVKDQQKITVYLYNVIKIYDGTPLEYAEDDYFVWSGLPNGYTMSLKIHGSQTEVGTIRINDIGYSDFAVYDENGNDVTSNFYVEFTGDQFLTVKPRALSLYSASQSKEYDGEPLTNSTVNIVQGSLVKGHTLYAEATGSITDVGSVKNTINLSDIVILDENGKDVTNNYDIKTKEGKLEVFE